MSVSGNGVFGGSVTASSFIATSTTATSTFAGFIDVNGTGTNATSTFAANLWVKGTLRAAVSYVGDLIFANNFRFTEGDLTAPIQTLNLKNQFGSTTVSFLDNGNATYSGSIFQSSDRGLKTNIVPLEASSSLSAILGLTPVSYTRLDQPDQGTNLGFIAQDVQQIFPNLVSTTSPTALTPNGTLTLNYVGLIAPIVEALKALAGQVSSLAATVAGFAQKFTTNELCIGSTCVTESQLKALLQNSGQQGSALQTTNTITITDVSSTTPTYIPAVSATSTANAPTNGNTASTSPVTDTASTTLPDSSGTTDAGNATTSPDTASTTAASASSH